MGLWTNALRLLVATAAACAAGSALADVAPCAIDPGLALAPSDAARLADLAGSRQRGLVAAAHDGDAEVNTAVAALYGGKGLQKLHDVVSGTYRCRTVKLGGKDGDLYSVAYGYFECRIAATAGGWSIVKVTGSQNFRGLLAPAGDGLVYKGASNYGYEGPHNYGDDAEDDQVGCMYAAPTGKRHYVLELPAPKLESLHDIIELVPGK